MFNFDMKIELPENPYLYFILLGGFLIIADFVLVGITGDLNIKDYLVTALGTIILVYGVLKLRKFQELREEKVKAEIELLKVKSRETEIRGRERLGNTTYDRLFKSK